jgi:hypothetical protein
MTSVNISKEGFKTDAQRPPPFYNEELFGRVKGVGMPGKKIH